MSEQDDAERFRFLASLEYLELSYGPKEGCRCLNCYEYVLSALNIDQIRGETLRTVIDKAREVSDE